LRLYAIAEQVIARVGLKQMSRVTSIKNVIGNASIAFCFVAINI